MGKRQCITIKEFQVLLKRTGLNLSDQELKYLKPMYEYWTAKRRMLDGIDLGTEDLATIFSPTSGLNQ